MPEDLVAVVKPYQHKAGTWSVTLPKDVVVAAGLEYSFKKGVNIPVYFDKKKRQVVYKFSTAVSQDE
jgi:hypothetical protein